MSITVPLTYSALEKYSVPVLTSDGSFYIDVAWVWDDDFNILFQVDLSKVAQYFEVTMYRIYAITPGIYTPTDTLFYVACDAGLTIDYECNYLYPTISNTVVNGIDYANCSWDVYEYSWTDSADEEWGTLSVPAPGDLSLPSNTHKNSTVVVCDSALSIYATQPITTLQFAVPAFDAEATAGWYYQDLMSEWDFSVPISEKVYVAFPDAIQWFADMAYDVLSIELFPGITIGGIVLAFVAIPIVVIFLRLFAGG